MVVTASRPDRLQGHFPMAVIVLGIALASGCGGMSGAKSSPANESVEVDGSVTVARISREAMQAFQKAHARVDVFVNKSGTDAGFAKYLQNEVDIVGASRPASPEEESRAKQQGIAWVRFLVGYDGVNSASIATGTPLYLYVKKASLRRPGVARFVRYYLENVEALATRAEIVGPTPADIAANKKTLDAVGAPASNSSAEGSTSG